MPAAEKMLVIASLVRSAYGQWKIRRILSGLVLVFGLTIIASVMICAIVIGGFYAAYYAFLHYGMSPQNAILIVVFSFGISTAVFVWLLMTRLRRLHIIPHELRRSSGASATDIVDAFLDGLMAEDAY